MVRVSLNLESNRKSGSYDISKPIFDLYAFRTVRGDALAKYNSLNQSEPLRINIYAFLTVTLLISPWLAEELLSESNFSWIQAVGTTIAAMGSGGLFLQECRRRSRQLTRFEKELEALDLQVRLPSNIWADSAFEKPRTLRQLITEKSIRVLTISGTATELSDAFQEILVLGRRLTQANTFVVVVPMDQSTRTEWNLDRNERYPWLAEPGSLEVWKSYVSSLTTQNDPTSGFRWFGLSATGRSFGSGTTIPSWIQVLGKSLLPTTILSVNDKPGITTDDGRVNAILRQQRYFYDALSTGNETVISTLFVQGNMADGVSRVLSDGGRLDDWKSCLASGARPEGLQISNIDATVISDTLAYTTAVEFPPATVVQDITLLAVQEWVRSTGSEEWKLKQHQTIPWASSPAGGTLICDCRGCVSLVRPLQRRSLENLIGR